MGISITVKLLDTSTEAGLAGKHVLDLIFETQQISLAELIKRRVIEEIELFENRLQGNGCLIELSDKEIALNSHKRTDGKTIDVAKAISKAKSQFQKYAYFVIVDGEQVTSLDHMIKLFDHMEVEFFRLIPLAGG